MRPIHCLLSAMCTVLIISQAFHAALAQDKTPTKPLIEKQGESAKGKDAAAALKTPAKPPSPLDLVMKDGIPNHGEKRAQLREDLYALLATAGTAKEAKKISRQLQRVWRTTGSDTVSVLMTRASRALKAKDKKTGARTP